MFSCFSNLLLLYKMEGFFCGDFLQKCNCSTCETCNSIKNKDNCNVCSDSVLLCANGKCNVTESYNISNCSVEVNSSFTWQKKKNSIKHKESRQSNYINENTDIQNFTERHSQIKDSDKKYIIKRSNHTNRLNNFGEHNSYGGSQLISFESLQIIKVLKNMQNYTCLLWKKPNINEIHVIITIFIYLFISIPVARGDEANQTFHQTTSSSSLSFFESSKVASASTLLSPSSSPNVRASDSNINSRSSGDITSDYRKTALYDDNKSISNIFNNPANNVRRMPNSYAGLNNDGSVNGASNNQCNTCKLREQVKADNLASIKRHILIRLEMRTLPNVTSKVVPREIIEKFYKNHSMFSDSSNTNRYGAGVHSNVNHRQRSSNDSSLLSSEYDTLQGDDPRIYDENIPNWQEIEEDEYEEEFFSVMNSIYIFPSSPRVRHCRKSEIHVFPLKNNGHSTVSQAILHIYIKGRDWLRKHEFVYPNNYDSEIMLTINRVVRHQNNVNATHLQKVNELRQIIPTGIGSWAQIDVTDLVTNWFNNQNSNHGIVIKTAEPWMNTFVVTDDSDKTYALYIEVATKDNRKRRTKRNTSLNCLESDNEERCCRYPLEVNFRDFDWDWIIAPLTFNAYYCNGECKLGFLPKYPHTHIMQLSTAPQPCCSPTKMSPIRLLYFNYEQQLVLSTIPNMAVDKCSCS